MGKKSKISGKARMTIKFAKMMGHSISHRKAAIQGLIDVGYGRKEALEIFERALAKIKEA